MARTPAHAYTIASQARNQWYGYDRSLDPVAFVRMVELGSTDPALRAAVDAVWALATTPEAGRG